MKTTKTTEPLLKKAALAAWWVVRDTGKGKFPPKFDREALYKSESQYVGDSLNAAESSRRAPWCLREGRRYMNKQKWLSLQKTLLWLDDLRLPLGSRVLEIGGGCGWLSEIITVAGYNTVCTTLAPHDVTEARIRADALVHRGLPTSMKAFRAAMESVSEACEHHGHALGFDACIVHGALHHAYSWKETIMSVHKCLRPGGRFLICDEPSWHHTIICYRGSMIEGRHEVGFWKPSLTRFLNRNGFKVRRTARRLSLSLPIWIDAEHQGEPRRRQWTIKHT